MDNFSPLAFCPQLIDIASDMTIEIYSETIFFFFFSDPQLSSAQSWKLRKITIKNRRDKKMLEWI